MANRRLFGWLILPDLSWLYRSVTFRALIIAAVAVAIFGGIYVAAGGVDVSANEPDGWLTRHFLHFTFKRSIGVRAREVEPPKDLASESRVRLGARQFDMVCANCHGAPGLGQSVVALSMSPRPQYLPKVVDQFSDAELHQILLHGVKFSAMPSWPTTLRGDEVWSMVAFIRQLPKMDAKTYAAMTAPAVAPEQTPDIPLGDAIALRPSDTQRNTPPLEEYLYAAPNVGFGDRTLHSRPVAACAGCHGAEGDGAATGGEAPNLTVHDAAYLRRALEAYSKGERKSGFMQEIASQLSSQQIDKLADYYAQLPVKAMVATTAPDAELLKRGEAIASSGIKETATAACSNCHESAGSKITNAPHIAGQNETFLRRQLTAMRNGGRGGSSDWNPMYAEAHDLVDRDIAGLAAYYSSMKPAKSGGMQLASAVTPTGNLARGQLLFDTVCTKCHLNGGRGEDAGLLPDLTIHGAPYVTQQLHSFRARVRLNTRMLETTQSLSYDDIASVAAYVNSLPAQKGVAPVDAAAAARGVTLAEKGDPARNLPACTSCHGSDGIAALPLIPRLQGQNTPYLKGRLEYFAAARSDEISVLNPMPAFATKLTSQERSDLAAYFAAATPLPKQAAQ